MLPGLANRLSLVTELRQQGDKGHVEDHADDETDVGSDLTVLDQQREGDTSDDQKYRCLAGDASPRDGPAGIPSHSALLLLPIAVP